MYTTTQASNPSALRKKYHKDELIPKIPEYASQSISHLLNGLLKKLPKERMSFSESMDDGRVVMYGGLYIRTCNCAVC